MTYRIVLGIAVIAAAVLTFFFLWGWADGALYGDSGLSSLFVVLAWGLIAASLAVNKQGNTVLAAVILMPVVWPAVGYGLMMLAFVVLQPSFR